MLKMRTLQERVRQAFAEVNRGREKKLTKTDLWTACKVSSGAVSQWFNGPTQSIQGATLLKAAELLNVDPHWLATGEGSKERGQLAVKEPIAEYKADAKNDAMLKTLLHCYHGLSDAHKDVLAMLANKLHIIDNPGTPGVAQPFLKRKTDQKTESKQ